jgi:hypothetical protein
MKIRRRITIWLGIFTAVFLLLNAFHSATEEINKGYLKMLAPNDSLKNPSFNIRATNCTICIQDGRTLKKCLFSEEMF